MKNHNKSPSCFHVKEAFADSLLEVNDAIVDALVSKESLVEEIGEYLFHAGGKRLRPILTLLFSEICGYNGKKHIFLAAAVELIHAATLLHDDVVDESLTRRNKPTANFKWGNKASILVGDFLFSQSFKLMVKSDSMGALHSLSAASAVIAEGEVMQLARLYENTIPTITEYEEIAKAKTAALFGASAEVGAIIANQSERVQNACKEYGIILGLIFQIIDDMLDYFSDEAVSGKRLGDDLAQGNITAPVILAYNKASADDKKKLEDIFFGEEREKCFEEVKSILVKYDIEQEIALYISAYHSQARGLIKLLPESSRFTPYLSDILEYAVNRSS